MPYADREKGLAYLKAYNAKRKESRKEYNKKYKELNNLRSAIKYLISFE